MSKENVIIIGAGIAGMEAAIELNRLGAHVALLETTDAMGGNVKNWHKLFPDFRNGDDIIKALQQQVNGMEILYNAAITAISRSANQFEISLSSGEKKSAKAILLATGFDTFDACKKEEYGYGIYDNVITSVELEKMLRETATIRTQQGIVPKRVGIIHCVGSRDEKINNIHCSKLCCVTGVKQAIEIRELLPDTEVFCFYMDLRMYGRHFEELYLDAQKKKVKFIRGRLSESFENPDHSILLKVEDTLIGKPLKMSVDLMVLLVGTTPSKAGLHVINLLGMENAADGFLKIKDSCLDTNTSSQEGVYFTGTCTGIKSVPETLADARSAALRVWEYIKEKTK